MTGPAPDPMEQVHRYLRGEVDVAAPRDAATVVLLRDGADGPEVYLLRRRSSMAFGAGMHVFPGGSVDPRDRDASIGWAGPAAAEWAERLSCDADLARALVCAAVRETFEESGVLLASTGDGAMVRDTTGEAWEADRLALIDGAVSLGEFLARRSLVLRADLLRPWSQWITPEWAPRRFDTRFFVAALPEGQRTRDVGGEADSVTWLPVAETLDRHRDGALELMTATATTLRELAEFADVASVLAAQRRVRPIMRRAVVVDGEVRLVHDRS
ncbi:NUDIX hydrolase [Blastococcus brunescens]|uniref:NUDIX hydrolase n=1 Tax=Blastococcus brunescens TaxID=1564165 RepID=A0ABZ1B3B6_9ACTN|nr:NUDIX hydrolase [Blastococcus sp. BMG 8361]WRL64216.1 NUDIX hydrolase [Blastococcus sp. BMG 8361]